MCLSTFALSLIIERALELSLPCFVLVHSEENLGQKTQMVSKYLIKDVVQFIKYDSSRSNEEFLESLSLSYAALDASQTSETILSPVIEKHRQREQKQSRMTGKKAACLVLHAFSKSKEKKMVRKQHFFPPTDRNHAYQTAHLQSMKHEHFVSGRRSSSEERNSCLALEGDYT